MDRVATLQQCVNLLQARTMNGKLNMDEVAMLGSGSKFPWLCYFFLDTGPKRTDGKIFQSSVWYSEIFLKRVAPSILSLPLSDKLNHVKTLQFCILNQAR